MIASLWDRLHFLHGETLYQSQAVVGSTSNLEHHTSCQVLYLLWLCHWESCRYEAELAATPPGPYLSAQRQCQRVLLSTCQLQNPHGQQRAGFRVTDTDQLGLGHTGLIGSCTLASRVVPPHVHHAALRHRSIVEAAGCHCNYTMAKQSTL